MKKSFILLLVSIILFSCKKEEKPAVPVMQEQSEMSALMLQMFDKNAEIKQKILKGEDLSDFPEEFLKIHTAILTDPSDRTPQFNAFSELYLDNQRVVFESPKDSAKAIYNNSINSCIACHQVACPGPIPRIRKLLIK
jgi:hypothetical protein